ncbi:MAG TPA: M15 family metallopeptidase [Acidimicrobiales bacterium]|nr:M15 family metallopeptidase [Acidimicrobiales bacterium]
MPAHPSRRSLAAVLAVLVAASVAGPAAARPGPAATSVAALGAGVPAVTAPAADDELDELVRRRLELTFARGLLELHDAVTREALAELAPRLAEAERVAQETQAELARATIEAQRAAAAEAATRAELVELERLMAEMAVAAYVRPPQSDELATLLDASSPAHAERMSVYLDAKASRDFDVAEALRRARARLEHQTRAARAAEQRSQERRAAAATALESLESARAEQEALLADIGGRLDTAELEAWAVTEEIDRTRDRVTAEARRQRDGGRGIPLTRVGEIVVHDDLAGPLAALLEAAEADGIRLGGGGYRDNASQIALRRAHCGEDDYAVYEMPASECSPPTARPGTSMHELGLAIDFTVGGQTISSRSSPAFRWLAEHAAYYGLYNLPSEPWHWSISGG